MTRKIWKPTYDTRVRPEHVAPAIPMPPIHDHRFRCVLQLTPQAKRTTLLTAIGHALYGKQWRTALAFTLDVSPRTIRYWIKRDTVPEWVMPRLKSILTGRAEALQLLLDEIS